MVEGSRSAKVVVSHLLPVFGMERAALGLVEGLASQGIELEVISLAGASPTDLVPDEVSTRSLGGELRGFWRILSAARAFRYAQGMPASDEPIIVVGAWAAVPWLLGCGSRKAKRTIVWEHSMQSEGLVADRRRRILAYLTGYLYRRAGKLVAVSLPLARDIARASGRDDVIAIPLGVAQATPSHTGLSRAAKQFATIGSLSAIKNQSMIIEAIGLVDDESTLTVFGDGPLREALERQAVELGMASRVEFAGYVENGVVRERLQEFAALIHASRSETFGFVFFEAADSGTPVIATRSETALSLIPEYIPGVVVEANAEAISRAIVSFEGSTPVELEAAALRRRLRFSPERSTRDWITVLWG